MEKTRYNFSNVVFCFVMAKKLLLAFVKYSWVMKVFFLWKCLHVWAKKYKCHLSFSSLIFSLFMLLLYKMIWTFFLWNLLTQLTFLTFFQFPRAFLSVATVMPLYHSKFPSKSTTTCGTTITPRRPSCHHTVHCIE